MRKIDNEINALKKIYNNYNSYLDLMKYFLPREKLIMKLMH